MAEEIIAYHCAPALFGIKPSNIVSISKKMMPEASKYIIALNNSLNKRGIYAEVICECRCNVLVIVYRKNLLEAQLRKKEIIKFLSEQGYCNCYSLRDYLDTLILRLKNEDFPHEIGAFLGYPLHDILGFMDCKNNKCLLVGEWKVYDEKEKAEALFKKYKKCRNCILKKIESGKTLSQILVK